MRDYVAENHYTDHNYEIFQVDSKLSSLSDYVVIIFTLIINDYHNHNYELFQVDSKLSSLRDYAVDNRYTDIK